MRVRLAFEKATVNPRVFVDDAEVTKRCAAVTLLPGRTVRLDLFKLNEKGEKYLEVDHAHLGEPGQLRAAHEVVEGALMEVTTEG